MRDYIDILLDALREQLPRHDAAWLLWQERETKAVEALMASLDDAQKDLYLACEDARNKADDLYESGMFRQIFLLAREIYLPRGRAGERGRRHRRRPYGAR